MGPLTVEPPMYLAYNKIMKPQDVISFFTEQILLWILIGQRNGKIF